MLKIKPILTFKTSKGSTYWADANGRTQRYKVYHEGHDPNDVGYKEPSQLTIYLNKEQSEFILKQKFPSWIVFSNKQLFIMKLNENGKPMISSEPIPFSDKPDIEKCPLELMKLSTIEIGEMPLSFHIGNTITEIEEVSCTDS